MLTAEKLREQLHYDPATGVFTRRVARANNTKVGDIAGSRNDEGYVVVKVLSHSYRAHRLAWLHVYGVWPQNPLDHINGIRDDNRIENLRAATHTENLRNAKKRKNTRCALKGVNFNKGRFRAIITVASKRIHLGYYDTEEDAHAAYMAAAEKEFGAFARAE